MQSYSLLSLLIALMSYSGLVGEVGDGGGGVKQDQGTGGTATQHAPVEPQLHPQLEWPADAGVVRVPMDIYLGHITLRVKLAEREIWAMLDSGAEVSFVNSATMGSPPAALPEVTVFEASQNSKAGITELPTLRIGTLTVRRVPALSVPMDQLPLGDRRLEVIVGTSVFSSAVVRIDYAKREILLARTREPLTSPLATPARIGLLGGGIPVVGVLVDGIVVPLMVDTGDDEGMALVKTWAIAHGFPGSRPSVDLKARTGIGPLEGGETLFRLGAAQLGPIRYDDQVVAIDDPPNPHLPGRVGNDLLSRCSAIVIDAPGSTLWLEPPCNHAAPGNLSGIWTLTRRDDPGFPGRPWVIGSIVPGSAASRAGLEPGDRILEVAGIQALPDISAVYAAVKRPPGTELPVEFAREGQRKRTRLVLQPLLRGQ